MEMEEERGSCEQCAYYTPIKGGGWGCAPVSRYGTHWQWQVAPMEHPEEGCGFWASEKYPGTHLAWWVKWQAKRFRKG